MHDTITHTTHLSPMLMSHCSETEDVMRWMSVTHLARSTTDLDTYHTYPFFAFTHSAVAVRGQNDCTAKDPPHSLLLYPFPSLSISLSVYLSPSLCISLSVSLVIFVSVQMPRAAHYMTFHSVPYPTVSS